MTQHSPRSLADQVQSLRRQFAQAPGLPFADVLADDAVQQAFHAQGGSGYDCVYTPLWKNAEKWDIQDSVGKRDGGGNERGVGTGERRGNVAWDYRVSRLSIVIELP